MAAIGVAVPAGAFARHGADDLVGHVRNARGTDEAAVHVRRARGADDPVGHIRGARGADDVAVAPTAPVVLPAIPASPSSLPSAATVTASMRDDHGGRGRGGDDGSNHT